MALVFKGYIEDRAGEEYNYDNYMEFIEALRRMAVDPENNPSADVYFTLNFEGYDDEKTVSPKLRIDFADNCYIHNIAPTNADKTHEGWEAVNDPNYPE